MKKNRTLNSYLNFSRKKWFSLKHETPVKITEKEIKILKQINKNLSINEINKIYLPLSNLLSLHINSNINCQSLINDFLKIRTNKIPYIISLAGSVAVGKSTIASILKILLSMWPEHRKVELITTDSFLFPNNILEKRGLIKRKGFPQSYNINCLVNFLLEIKSGAKCITTPIYSHLYYDIIPDTKKVIKKPDILIIEGLNVLQPVLNYLNYSSNYKFISDFVDFSIYVHASEKLLESWYIDRFLKFRKYAILKNSSYFSKYTHISEKRAVHLALKLWKKVNFLNLKKNILPTRKRAKLIIIKSNEHIVKYIRLRKYF